MQIKVFSTDRFHVAPWGALLADPQARVGFERALGDILTPPVLAHLPGSLQLDGPDAVPAWIAARDAESQVLTIHTTEDRLVGLVILAVPPGGGDVHLGYLLAEWAWGQGAATEILHGLVAALRPAAPLRLVGGVDAQNPASARVLEKAGFTRDDTQSTPQSAVYSLDLT